MQVVYMADRKASIERKTRETQISAAVDVDGEGRFDVECGIGFLKHMVETLSRYSGMDVALRASGDDDHHVIEDTAITLGKAFARALGDGPIERMADRTVVMDDAMVSVALDIVDRPYAEIDCPDPMYVHFFRSFAMAAGITLHILVVRGSDAHHIVEASFKAVGLCLRDASRPRRSELSTKDRAVVARCWRRGSSPAST